MTESVVKMTVHWFVPLGESRSITDALHGIMIRARARRDCLGCSLATEAGPHVRVRYAEEWADEASLRRELRSDRFSTLAVLMESATEPPTVEIMLPGGTRGLDYVEEVRATELL
jgi:quinol monooxygenase YgiN